MLGFGWFADGTGFMVGAGKGVDCLRAVPEPDMIKASRAYYATLQAPRIGLGVVIDGNLVPDFPPYLVAQGHFHKNITILVSNDDNEVYMPLDVSSSTAYTNYLNHRANSSSATATPSLPTSRSMGCSPPPPPPSSAH